MENNKNIWLLPTNEPSRLYFNNNDKNLQFCKVDKKYTPLKINQNIYITSDEEIKEGDWYIYGERILQANFTHKPLYKVKIILTTDTKLIADGIQAIEDEFLEWFVNNPNCEDIEIKKCINTTKGLYRLEYKIIIPKEEPKPFKDMQQLTEVDWKKFKKKPFISKKEPKQGTMSEAIKQVINNQLKQETVMENKTPMQELIEYIELNQPKNKITDGIWSKAKSLLEKEKQVIEDEFLEWFVKNPSCERVEVKKGFADGSAYGYDFLSYKIIIPKVSKPTSMENKTPMQELIDELEQILSVSSNPLISMNLRLNIELAKSKLEKEKELFVNTFIDGEVTCGRQLAQDYYNEKFNKNE